MGINERLGRATRFEQWIIEYLRRSPAIVAVTEAGAGVRAPEFQHALCQLKTPQARLHRYHPDGHFIHSDIVYYFDTKIGLTLERDAYLTYRHYSRAMTSPVVLFVLHDEWVHWQYVHRIAFRDSTGIVAQYPPARRFPVIDNWIYPRDGDQRHVTKDMSGTPYAYMKLDSLRPLCRCPESELDAAIGATRAVGAD